MRTSFLAAVVFLVSAVVASVSSAKEFIDSFAVGLDPSEWRFSSGLEAESQEGTLVMTSAGQSAWATPAVQWPVSPKIELEVQGSAGGGKMAVQVEWFDSAGAILSADGVLKLTGEGVQVGSGELTPPANATRFRLKFWMEGAKIHASLERLTLTRASVWQKGGGDLKAEPAAVEPKLSPDKGLTVTAEGTTMQLTLEEGTGSAGVHFDNPVEVRDGLRVLVPVLELPPGSSVSLQALCWNKSGAGRSFLGQMDLIKGIAEVADYDVKIPTELEDGKQPKFITLKVWAIGKAGKPIRLGAIHPASPEEK
jgi:hypothetical protein